MKFTRTLFLLLCLAFLCVAGNAQESPLSENERDTLSISPMDPLNIPIETIHGSDTTLAAFAGKVVLIVNVASKCGYTPQYEDLEALYRRFREQGFVVIGFPANNFKDQEPGTNAEILEFCRATYGVTFPMMAKISVKGEDQHALYRYLTTASPFPGEITWNFNKFLLDREGRVAARFETKTGPNDPVVISAIEKLLNP